MKKLFIMGFMLAVGASTVSAQVNRSKWTDKKWTSGSETLFSVVIDSRNIVLGGAGYYDAGYGSAYSVKETGKAGEYKLTGVNPAGIKLPQDYDFMQLNEPDSRIMERRMYQGVDVIVVKNEKNEITDIYAPLDPGQDMSEREIINKKMILCGDSNEGTRTYKTKEGAKFSFSDNGNCIFNGQSLTYSIGYDEAAPAQLFELSNGKIYWYEVTKDGIDIFNNKVDEDSGFSMPGTLYKHLLADKTKPRWAYYSHMVINESFLTRDKEMLRLMRNEIFARKGYVFNDAALDKYFRSLPWYKPGKDNSKITLSAIESLNVEYLKYKEKEREEN